MKSGGLRRHLVSLQTYYIWRQIDLQTRIPSKPFLPSAGSSTDISGGRSPSQAKTGNTPTTDSLLLHWCCHTAIYNDPQLMTCHVQSLSHVLIKIYPVSFSSEVSSMKGEKKLLCNIMASKQIPRLYAIMNVFFCLFWQNVTDYRGQLLKIGVW